jgi:hypothetical protein
MSKEMGNGVVGGCPACGSGELRIYPGALSIRVHEDESWDIETPFQFQSSDRVYCFTCVWEGLVEELVKSVDNKRRSV